MTGQLWADIIVISRVWILLHPWPHILTSHKQLLTERWLVAAWVADYMKAWCIDTSDRSVFTETELSFLTLTFVPWLPPELITWNNKNKNSEGGRSWFHSVDMLRLQTTCWFIVYTFCLGPYHLKKWRRLWRRCLQNIFHYNSSL